LRQHRIDELIPPLGELRLKRIAANNLGDPAGGIPKPNRKLILGYARLAQDHINHRVMRVMDLFKRTSIDNGGLCINVNANVNAGGRDLARSL
jgi:hypothetical protein